MSGRTKPLYVVSRPWMSRTADALRTKPIRWAARTATERRRWPKLNVLSKVMHSKESQRVSFFHSDTIKLHGREWPWTEMPGDSRGFRL